MTAAKVAGGWRTNPDVTAAKEVADRHEAVVAIVLWINKDGRVSGASYGVNRILCNVGGGWLDEAVGAVEDAIDAIGTPP